MKTTHDIVIAPGIPPASELLAILTSTYSAQEVEQAIAQGAKIQVGLITPWPRPKKPKTEAVIEPGLLDHLHQLNSAPDALEAKIAELNGPQVLKIGELLGIPMSKGAKTEALRARLFGSLRSEAMWRGISGQPPESDAAQPEETAPSATEVDGDAKHDAERT